MHLAENWETAAAAAAGMAVVAKLARAVTWSGAVAGLVVGVAVAAGFGVAGLIVLGTFFVVGSVATRVGYARKAARGAAEERGGARDWRNVVGKGGFAALMALSAACLHPATFHWRQAFAGALAAALADTLGTEIGSLSTSQPRTLPTLRPVPPGTRGAVTLLGTVAAGLGAVAVALAANRWGLINGRDIGILVSAAGLGASLVESLAVGIGWRAPGFVRNLLTTGVGAVVAASYYKVH